MSRQLIDSHVHLFEVEHIDSLSWMTQTSPLLGQHSVAEYVSSTLHQPSPRQLAGFIFIEVDRIKNPPSKLEGWKHSLQEYSFVASIALGMIPKYATYSSLVLGIVPWAPLPYGSSVMQQYERQLCALHSESINGVQKPYKVKGCWYLLQNEARRTMLGARFLESLRWMGMKGYVFECTVDCRRNQLWQLDEVIEMMERVNRKVAAENLVQVVVSKKISRRFWLFRRLFGSKHADRSPLFQVIFPNQTSPSIQPHPQNRTPIIKSICCLWRNSLDFPMLRSSSPALSLSCQHCFNSIRRIQITRCSLTMTTRAG
jgi:hypothetical protein